MYLQLDFKPAANTASRTQRVRSGSAPSRHPTIEVPKASSSVRHPYHIHEPGLTRAVYDVSNRESFDALPRWYSELETYVSSSVVKIVVGNKVDKVRSSHHPLSPPTNPAPQEFSRQVSTTEGQLFATRMDSLFIEASAKTALGVNETFQEVVAKILATPELWDKSASQPTSGGRGGMPGGVQVVGVTESHAQDSGCAC